MEPMPAALSEALRQAHEALLDDLRGLDDAVRSPAGKEPAEITAHLGRTQAHVTEHFRFEETNGYMESVLRRKPHLERAAHQLLEEHRQLALSLNGLIEEAKAAKRLDEAFPAKVRAWIEDVHQHESRETRLVQDAFNVDIGPED